MRTALPTVRWTLVVLRHMMAMPISSIVISISNIARFAISLAAAVLRPRVLVAWRPGGLAALRFHDLRGLVAFSAFAVLLLSRLLQLRSNTTIGRGGAREGYGPGLRRLSPKACWVVGRARKFASQFNDPWSISWLTNSRTCPVRRL